MQLERDQTSLIKSDRDVLIAISLHIKLYDNLTITQIYLAQIT